MVKAVYLTEALLHKNAGKVGHHSETVTFPTLTDALAGPIPSGFVTGLINSPEGDFTFWPRFGQWMQVS